MALLAWRAVATGRPVFVPVTVLLETECVLRSAFGFEKPTVLDAFNRLLSSFDVRFESESAVEVAVACYERSKGDFADCLHAALAAQAGEAPLWTFDKTAANVDGVRLLA